MGMNLEISDIYPIKQIDGNCALGLNGDISFLFCVSLPEKYSLGETDFDRIHNERIRFYSMLPHNTVVHNQHFYLEQKYFSDIIDGTFLQYANAQYFNGREYILHLGFMYITYTNMKSLKRNYLNSGLFSKQTVKTDLNALNDFKKSVERAVTFINNSGYIKLSPLEDESAQNVILNYITGFNGHKLTDIEFKPVFKIGDNYCKLYALIDSDSIPKQITNIIEDRNISTPEHPFYKSFFEPVGLELEHNHVVNQFVYIDSHKDHVKELDEKQQRLEQFAKFGRENKTGAEELDSYLDEIQKDSSIFLMRSHINVLTWSKDIDQLNSIDNKLISAFQQLDITPYYPTVNDHVYYFLSSIPTNAGCLPRQETFTIDLKSSACFDITETNYQSDQKGILFNDRISNLPVVKDVYYEPYESKLISSRNFFIVAPTGGGKSVLLKKIVRSFLEDDFICVIIDLGGGFEVVSKLFPDDTLYVQYKQGEPLGINPFLIGSSAELDANKVDIIRDFIFILWLKGEDIDDNYRVSLGKIIREYYHSHTGKYDFYTFYEFVKKESKKDLLQRLEIEPDFFPVREFLHRLSEYYKDGNLEFLFRDHSQIQNIKGKRLIIFELESIRENYNVLPVALSMIRDTIENVVFRNVDKKKLLCFEEAAKTLTEPVMFRAINYYLQTGRKHGCATGLVLQYINNVPRTDEGNAMVQNTHVFYLLEHDKGYDELKERCNFSEHSMYQLKSLRNNLMSEKPYTEFVLVRGKQSNIFRLELPEEELLCYLSEGDIKQQLLDEHESTQDMQQAIYNILNQ